MLGVDALLSFQFKAPPPFAMHPMAKTFLDKHGYFSSHALLGWVTDRREDTRIAFEFLEKIRDWSPLFQIEFLAKVVALRSLQLGDEIPLEEGYTVDRIFFLAPHFPAFGLQGKNASILLFRGTDFRWKGRSSMLSDLDLRGPGYRLYQKNRAELRSWLQGRQAWVTGFSLGGALTTQAALFDHDLLSPDLPSIAFNGPGLYRSARKKFTAASRLIHYINAGDPVSKVGTLVGEVRTTTFPRKLRPIEAHVTPIFCLINNQ